MNSLTRNCRAKGFTLIELMIALAISSIVVLGVTKSYAAINAMIQDSENLEQSQEIIRFSAQVFKRSLKQTGALPVINATNDQLTITQDANSLACDGSRPNAQFTEIYTVAAQNLTCTINANPPTILLNGVTAVNFVRAGNLVTINVSPNFLPQNFAGGSVTINVALTRVILAGFLGGA